MKKYYTKKQERIILVGFVVTLTFLALGIPKMARSVLFPRATMAQIEEKVEKGTETQKEEKKVVSKEIRRKNDTSGLPSQEQKNIVAIACDNSYKKYIDNMVEWNISKGVFMTTCYNDILAIAYHESRFDTNAIGDKGNSRGAFQIYKIAHPSITDEQAFDFSFSANWTIDRLMRKGYPKFRSYAVKAHNGLGGDGSYEKAVKKTSDRFARIGL